MAKIRNDMEEIKRDRYHKQLIDSQQNGFIKVITGIRRCGKSYLLMFNLNRPTNSSGLRNMNLNTEQTNTL